MRYSVIEQDGRYRQLLGLDRAVDHNGGDFDQFDLRAFLEESLHAIAFSETTPRVLEYGTGTGPGACFLAARGFAVDAIDISASALKMARRFAAERGLTIHFNLQDICDFPKVEKNYDLVVDNFCLQRLITDERRQQAFSVVRSILKPGGYFVIGTVIYRPERTLPEDEICDETTGIVYRLMPPNTEPCDDLVLRDGVLVYPRVRRVRPEALRRELEAAGFRILRQDGGRVLCTVA